MNYLKSVRIEATGVECVRLVAALLSWGVTRVVSESLRSGTQSGDESRALQSCALTACLPITFIRTGFIYLDSCIELKEVICRSIPESFR